MSDSNNQVQTYKQPASSDMSVVDWIVTFFGLGIPLVGIVCWVMWIGDSVKKPSRRTFLIAYVIWCVILIILSMIFWSSITSVLMNMLKR